MWAILVVVIPIALMGSLFSDRLLGIWLGNEFVQHGRLPMQILWVGFALNAISQLPFIALHSLGRT